MDEYSAWRELGRAHHEQHDIVRVDHVLELVVDIAHGLLPVPADLRVPKSREKIEGVGADSEIASGGV